MAQTDRLHSFRIRASQADLAAWERAAANADMNRTSWLRSLAADAAAGTRHPGILADEIRALRRELSACGNNLNQIAHRLNSGSRADPEAALDRLGNLMGEVSDFLHDAHAPKRKGGSRTRRQRQ
ncbi:plasmid mobilization relaxosome protein MobC [Gluconobacter oxydans]|uniref:Mobilization protein n=1 Tax=Gluconobacter oxydans NBRC 3293 TaxID=1315969 RepID=A0A829WSD2_GLUOY|nr:plasmid mobilization relaxosome protein MobC [Gluconobacter oxydans]GEM15771.1 mobilization protein [Gluconobacter oxydans NBRC 3293]